MPQDVAKFCRTDHHCILGWCVQAAKHIHLGHTDTEGRWSVFGQAFRQV